MSYSQCGLDVVAEEEGQELVPLYVYHEEPPVPLTREQVIHAKLEALRDFCIPEPEQPDSDATGGLAYLETCERIHKTSFMKFPTTSIVRILEASGELLDLSHAGLGRKGCTALAAAIEVNPVLTSLVLIDNYIGPTAALEIARAIAKSRIATVDLSNNRLGESELAVEGLSSISGGAVINELLGPAFSVTHLMLRSNGLVDRDIALFSDTLADNVNLVHLDLSYNNIGYMGAVELAKSVSRNGDLRELNLEWNQLRTTGALHFLSEGLLLNNTIKTCHLSWCGLDDACAQLISRVLGENAIEEIFIANNRIGPPGADSIAKGLQQTSSLTLLVLDGNPLQDGGCTSILNVALGGDIKTLRLLSMQHCGCSCATEQRGRAGNTDELTIRISEGCTKAGGYGGQM